MRCRVSGVSGKLEESMTILRRDRTSAPDPTSSLTTAAMRVAPPWSGAGCPGGACAGPRCAGAGSALLEKPARLISTKPNQRVIVIDEQPPTSIGLSNAIPERRLCRQQAAVAPVRAQLVTAGKVR